MKITFDSNVFQLVVEPKPNSPNFEEFSLIERSIITNKIYPFISESTFYLEDINKKDRLPFIQGIKSNFNISEEIEEGDCIVLKIEMHTSSDKDIEMNERRRYYWNIANSKGFKILGINRINLIKNKNMKDEWFAPIDNNILDRMSECSRCIEEHECGFYHIKLLADQYINLVDPRYFNTFKNAPWYEKFKYIKSNNEQESKTLNKKVAKAFAEWADGDTVAAHYAYGNDYICTNDIGRSAGSQSIFSSNNRAWLKDDFGIKIITPKELADLILGS